MDYKTSGVNIGLGDDASKILYEAARMTWDNRKGTLGEVIELFPDFSGLRAVHVGGLPADTYMNMGFDGVGTKMDIAERMMKHDTVAYDLFAMVCDDAVIRGAEPVLIGSILDVKSLGGIGAAGAGGKSHIEFVKQLAVGYVNAAKEANVAVVNGEVAELGARVNGYGEFNYNWGAGIVWFGRESRMLSGHDIKAGDSIVALKETGFRSNGWSLVRRILSDVYGPEWHNASYNGKSIGEQMLQPSRIYSRAVVDMFGGIFGQPKAQLHGAAHITGGGIPGKLGRTLRPTGLGAYLYDLFEPPEMMLHCQEKGNVRNEEAYSTWNMGQGMLLITLLPEAVMQIAKSYGIESRVVGTIIDKPQIQIRNKSLDADRKPLLTFDLKR